MLSTFTGVADPSANATSAKDDIVPRWWLFGHTFGIGLAVLAGLAIAAYVFWLTPYQDFLFSDMKEYWNAAMQRLNGHVFDDSQFIAWPPLYHIFLAELFRVLRSAGLDGLVRLETALALNIFAYAISVYAFQRVAARWFERRWSLLLAMLLYAFGFPALYFNAFLLAENLGAPLLVMAIAALICHRNWAGITAAACLFATAVIVRPAMGPYGLAFVACLFARQGFNRRFIAQAALFSVLFFALIATASQEVARISHGRVTGLSANGGLDFFLANTDYHRIELNYNGWHFFVIVPAQSWTPENGVFYTSVPFYEQGYYFRLGWEALKHDPMRMVRNIGEIEHLFFADMLPSRDDAPGFTTLRPIWDWMKLVMCLTAGLLVLRRGSLGARAPTGALLGTLIVTTMVVSVIFTGEPRYTYSIIFAFYLLSLKQLELLLHDARRWLKPLLGYLLLLGASGSAVAGVVSALQPVFPPHLAFHFASYASPPTLPQRDFTLGRLLFPFNREGSDLVQADDPAQRVGEPGLIRIRTDMEVLGDKPLEITFRVYSSWFFSLLADDQALAVGSDPDFFRENEATHSFSPGHHVLELQTNYQPDNGGLAANYIYADETGWATKHMVGIDSPRVRFHLPATPQQDTRAP